MTDNTPTTNHPAWHRFDRERNVQERVADKITSFAGSMLFIYIHIVWFAAWILLRIEAFPYGLLTMIVSLEAILLSTFVMIGQNRQARIAELKAEHDYQAQTLELKHNTDITEAIHELVKSIDGRSK